ncbi:phosphate ABC transporter permease subunit PstC [Thioalkalivibrio sp. XN279]|uniref:phosphate ABC transporter permease subunit PstC n=1 Tax=Thioalkalivibrio sp. XN279 TaxID=2714953 RepID=UPI0014091515|nr:phosphate ABC transporter permease subunit PstC [Thioalkalivibrio sp. XN279]NHA15311.1 phosphate ABC transporter permease subunit PstC [Thioalkalivibrio sp. XN279]
MPLSTVVLVLLVMSAAAFVLGKRRSLALADAAGGIRGLHSLPSHYGTWAAVLVGVPAILFLFAWRVAEPVVFERLVIADLPAEIQALEAARLGLFMNDVRNAVVGNIVTGQQSEAVQAAAARYVELQGASATLRTVLVFALAIGGLAFGYRSISMTLRARNRVENLALVFLIASSTLAIFTTLGIVLSVLFESIRFFQRVPITEFLFGLNWSPQTALRADQVGASGAFGAVPLFAGTLLISFIAMLVAGPIGLMVAIYLAEYAPRQMRTVAKPLLEILAGVPTVVYGFFAALVVAPQVRAMGVTLGLDVASESALAAGLVMGIMIIPFVSSLSDDVINAVPQAMRDGAYALGATKAETIKQVIIPAALPGIVGGFLLAVSRAIGETMIVVMAAGLAANLTANPLEAVTTVTVQIVTLLVGDQEFDSAKTLAAFALGLVLFVVTLILNVIALHVVRKYREQYE